MPILTSKAFSSYLIKVERKFSSSSKVIKWISANQAKLELNCKWIYLPLYVCCLSLCQPSKLSLWVKLKHTPNHIPCSSSHSLRTDKVRSGVCVCLQTYWQSGTQYKIKRCWRGCCCCSLSRIFERKVFKNHFIYGVGTQESLSLVCKFYFHIIFSIDVGVFKLFANFSFYLFHFI